MEKKSRERMRGKCFSVYHCTQKIFVKITALRAVKEGLCDDYESHRRPCENTRGRGQVHGHPLSCNKTPVLSTPTTTGENAFSFIYNVCVCRCVCD